MSAVFSDHVTGYVHLIALKPEKLLFSCLLIIFSRSKFHEFDMQPLCKKCYEKMPLELKKRLKKAEQTAGRK